MENALGKRIKFLREEKELSQLEFSKVLNISNSTLSQYEAGNRMPGDEIKKKIAEYFNVSLDYLMGASDIRNPYESTEEDLTNEEKKLLETILKDSELSILFHELKNAPKRKIKQLLKTWEFINEQFDDMEKEGDE